MSMLEFVDVVKSYGECVANFDNITPMRKSQFVTHVGQLGATELSQACAAARFAIDC